MMAAVPKIELAQAPARSGMDRKVHHARWSPARWPLAAKVALGALALVLLALLAVKLIAGTAERTLRLPAAQATFAKVEQGIFHDLIPLRANVVPRETI